jgi:hypothetical protein
MCAHKRDSIHKATCSHLPSLRTVAATQVSAPPQSLTSLWPPFCSACSSLSYMAQKACRIASVLRIGGTTLVQTLSSGTLSEGVTSAPCETYRYDIRT